MLFFLMSAAMKKQCHGMPTGGGGQSSAKTRDMASGCSPPAQDISPAMQLVNAM